MEVLANIIVIFILFVWIPYMCFCVLRFVWYIINPFPFLRSLLPKPKAVEKPIPTIKTSVRKPKPLKSSYAVESSFKEEYRITNPVEFDT